MRTLVVAAGEPPCNFNKASCNPLRRFSAAESDELLLDVADASEAVEEGVAISAERDAVATGVSSGAGAETPAAGTEIGRDDVAGEDAVASLDDGEALAVVVEDVLLGDVLSVG